MTLQDRGSMLQGALVGPIFRYAIPIMFTNLLQTMFSAADMAVVGQFCGTSALAAVGATGMATTLLVYFFVGISAGGGIAVAHGLGEHDDQAVFRAVHTALPVAVLCGVFVTVVGILTAEPFLRMTNIPENTLASSLVYMRIYFAGSIFSVVYNFSAAILRAAGDSKSPLYFLIVSGITNVVLNINFVCVFDMNVAGVALATIISQAISAVLAVRTLVRRTDICKLHIRKMRIYKEQLLKILRIGIPMGVQESLFSISSIVVQSAINGFGDVVMSANTAATSIESFGYAMMNAFNHAATNFIGQNYGAKQYKRTLKIYGICIGCVVLLGMGFAVMVITVGEHLLSLYIVDSAEALAYGSLKLLISGIPYALYGLIEVSIGALLGYGASVVSMIISVLCICGARVVWIYTVFQLPQYHSPKYLFLCYPLSWLIASLSEVTAFLIIYSRKKKAASKAEMLAET